MDLRELERHGTANILACDDPGFYMWVANTSIRKTLLDHEVLLLNPQKDIPIYVDFDEVKKLKEEHPGSYIDILRIYKYALMNQAYYMIDGDKVEIACSRMVGETHMWHVFSLLYTCNCWGGRILYIQGVESSPTLRNGRWLSVKTMSRTLSRKLSDERNKK